MYQMKKQPPAPTRSAASSLLPSTATASPVSAAIPHAPAPAATARAKLKTVERIQTGIRLEKRLLKVLKGIAEYHDLYLGDLLEGICLHAFENKPPFSPATLQRIQLLREVYHLDLTAEDSHHLIESAPAAK